MFPSNAVIDTVGVSVPGTCENRQDLLPLVGVSRDWPCGGIVAVSSLRPARRSYPNRIWSMIEMVLP